MYTPNVVNAGTDVILLNTMATPLSILTTTMAVDQVVVQKQVQSPTSSDLKD